MKQMCSSHGYPHAIDMLCDLAEDGREMALSLLGCIHETKRALLFPLSLLCECALCGYHSRHQCGCEIPPPCWGPQPIGELCSTVCPGGTATVRLRVGNCGGTDRKIDLEGKGITITPATLDLAPMERGYAVASVAMPPEGGYGFVKEFLLWVRGSQDHYLRWIVRVARHPCNTCQEVCVEDCPDPIHHWYDHFYCEHRRHRA